MSFKWNHDQIEHLIICVEQKPCIYNIKSTQYLDRVKKAQAYNSILEEIQKMEASITLDEIKRKWKNLRTQYSQELRARTQSLKSGSGKEDVYVPKLWCFHQLNFLKTHTEIRKSINNCENKENTLGSADDQHARDEPPKKRVKPLSAVNAFRNDLGDVKTLLSQRKSGKKFGWLGNLVAYEMEQISPADQDEAAWEVQCLMRRLKKRSRTSNLSTSSTPSTSIDILQQSMEGVLDDDDFNDFIILDETYDRT